jgi:hypothetical protein
VAGRDVGKFALGFDIITRDQVEASITGNPFIERNRLIIRLDMAARSGKLRAKLGAARLGSCDLRRSPSYVSLLFRRRGQGNPAPSVDADAKDGFSEPDIGVVRDNTRQLKFKPESTGF